MKIIEQAYAQLSGQMIPLPNASDPSEFSWQTVLNYATTIINLLIRMAGIVAFVLFLYAAILYVTSYGDEKQAETAKKTMMWAVIGLIVVAAAAFIVNFVGSELSS